MCPRTRLWREIRRSCCGISTRSQGSNYDEQREDRIFWILVGVHEELEKELVAVFQKALKTAGFIGGPMVEEFERSFAEFCGTRFAIGVNSGTDALRFALIAAGVREGDAVVTVANTFIATTEAISQAGARPGIRRYR